LNPQTVRLRFQRRQRGFQLTEPFLGPLADEFRGEMEIRGKAPINPRGGTQPFEKPQAQ